MTPNIYKRVKSLEEKIDRLCVKTSQHEDWYLLLDKDQYKTKCDFEIMGNKLTILILSLTLLLKMYIEYRMK